MPLMWQAVLSGYPAEIGPSAKPWRAKPRLFLEGNCTVVSAPVLPDRSRVGLTLEVKELWDFDLLTGDLRLLTAV